MSNRHAVLRASTVLLVAVAFGCTLPTGTKKGAGAPGDPNESNVAGGGLKGTGVAGAGLISNNSGGISGVVRGPAVELIANNAAGLISNNSGGLISNNSGGLISNNSGGLISGNTAGYHVAASGDKLVPLPNVKVAVYDVNGTQISFESATTDATGAYTFERLKDSPPMIFVEVEYEADGRKCTLMAATMAPRKESVTVQLDPVSTMAAKKVRELLRTGQVPVATMKQATLDQLKAALAGVMSVRAGVAAVIFENNKAARTFDNMITESSALRDAVQKIITNNGAGNLLQKTPETVGLTPNQPTVKASPTPSVKPSTAASTTPGDTPATASPSPTPTPPPPKGTVATIGKVSANSGLAFSGGVLFAGSSDATSGGVQTATPANLTATLTFTTDAAVKPLAVTFDGTKKYLLTATGIVTPTGPVTLTGMSNPTDFAVSGATAYVLSQTANALYSVNLTTGQATLLAGQEGTTGFLDGKGAAATFTAPTGLVLSGGALYVADGGSRLVRKVTLDGTVSAFAGKGSQIGKIDGKGDESRFSQPQDITADAAGNLYVADYGNHNIRKITADGTVTTIAGNDVLKSQDGVGETASFSFLSSIAFGSVAGVDALFVSEASGNIRAVSKW